MDLTRSDERKGIRYNTDFEMNNSINPIIVIPAASREEHIGSVFNHVFSVMFQTEQTDINRAGNIVWDFSGCTFLHPFYLAALSVLKFKYQGRITCQGAKPLIKSYFDIVYFADPLVVTEGCDRDGISRKYSEKTYLPICVFNPKDKSSIIAQELVQHIVKNQLRGSTDIFGILSLLLAELIDNITDHSHSPNGFIFCQRIPKEGNLYVFIGDSGRSIYSSYAADPRYSGMLSTAESSALALALQGKSTKNRPENENRGYGISKSRSLIVEGLKGEFFILSGGSFYRHDPQGETLVDLPDAIRWDGTVVLLKIPTAIPREFNIYDYIS